MTILVTPEQIPKVTKLLQKFPRHKALRAARGNFEVLMKISPQARHDLYWWIQHLPKSASPVSQGQPHFVLETDVSSQGYGMHLLDF